MGQAILLAPLSVWFMAIGSILSFVNLILIVLYIMLNKEFLGDLKKYFHSEVDDEKDDRRDEDYKLERKLDELRSFTRDEITRLRDILYVEEYFSRDKKGHNGDMLLKSDAVAFDKVGRVIDNTTNIKPSVMTFYTTKKIAKEYAPMIAKWEVEAKKFNK